jgi:hypothetical protein
MSGGICSVREYAAMLGTSERWVRYLCKKGKIKAVKLGQWIILENV